MKLQTFRLTSLGVIAALVLSLLPLSVGAAPLLAGISLAPGSGAPGTSVSVNVDGFKVGGTAQILWDGGSIGKMEIQKDGTGEGDFDVPANSTPGKHSVIVCIDCSAKGEKAAAQFDVTGPAVPPTATLAPLPTVGPTTAVIAPPSIKNFSADDKALDAGKCTTLHWSVLNAASILLDKTQVKALGDQQVCPAQTTTYILTVNGFKSAKPPSVSSQITIDVNALPTPTPTPSPFGVIDLSDLPPISFFPAVNTGVCTSLNLGTGATVINFDDRGGLEMLTNEYASQGVRFIPGTAYADRPRVATRSGAVAVRSNFADLGSGYAPIRINFDRLQDAVGVYVGRDTGSIPLSAQLTGYGYDASHNVVPLVSESILLPATTVPIQRCLSVRAPAGQGLRSVSLEYFEDGVSAYDKRWLDDLTFVPSALPNPNLAPVVTIVMPPHNSVQNVDGFTLRAQVTEDIRLVSVEARVNGGVPLPMGFGPASDGNPTHYEAYLGGLPGLRPHAINTIEVTAVDNTFNRSSASTTFTFNPPSQLDLQIMKTEVTQAIQCIDNPTCADNSVPLYTNKPTLVRAYAQIARGPASMNNVTALLCPGNTGADGCASPINAGPVTLFRENPPAASRADLRSSFNFVLPLDWTARPGRLQFTVYINFRGSRAPEVFYDNNRQVVNLNVQVGKRLDVVFLPIGGNGITPNINERWAIVDWLRRVYPVSSIGVYETREPIRDNYNFVDTSGSGCGDGWSSLLDDLWWYNAWRDDPVDWLRYYGMVDIRSIGAATYKGCGKRPGDEAAGIVSTGNRTGPEIAAQEIAHNHGRMHAPSGGAANTDGSYPNRSGVLDEYGVDVGRMQLYVPASSFDYMGYAGSENNTWTSLYTYRAMAGALQAISRAPTKIGLAARANPQQATRVFFAGSGRLNHTSVEILHGFYKASLLANAHDVLAYGPYTVELQDIKGSVLFSRDFAPNELSNEDPSPIDEGTFQMILPWIDGTTSIVFKYNGQVLATRSASGHSPVVQIVAPNGGEKWSASEQQTITWTSRDEDKDALAYSVLYTPDKGTSWVTLIANTADTQLTINTKDIPGGESAYVKVIATDGFNTSEDLSDDVFVVEAKGPDVYIGSPIEGQHITAGFPVVLQAYGTDFEDGPLPETAFSWSSDKDGALGDGDQLLADHLSVGDHTLTLTGKDSSGNTGTYSVKITIDAKPPLEPDTPIEEAATLVPPTLPPAPGTAAPALVTPPPAAPSGPTSILPIALIMIGVGILLLIVIVVLLRRRTA